MSSIMERRDALTSNAHDDGPGEAEVVELEAVHRRHAGTAVDHNFVMAAAKMEKKSN